MSLIPYHVWSREKTQTMMLRASEGWFHVLLIPKSFPRRLYIEWKQFKVKIRFSHWIVSPNKLCRSQPLSLMRFFLSRLSISSSAPSIPWHYAETAFYSSLLFPSPLSLSPFYPLLFSFPPSLPSPVPAFTMSCFSQMTVNNGISLRVWSFFKYLDIFRHVSLVFSLDLSHQPPWNKAEWPFLQLLKGNPRRSHNELVTKLGKGPMSWIHWFAHSFTYPCWDICDVKLWIFLGSQTLSRSDFYTSGAHQQWMLLDPQHQEVSSVGWGLFVPVTRKR